MRQTAPEDFDCQACGACCIAAGPIPVYPHDEQVPRRRTVSVRRTVGFASFEADEGVRQMASEPDGCCRALTGTPGKACACAIYSQRPSGCQDFQPGSLACLKSRQRVGIQGSLANAAKRARSPRIHDPVRS